MSSDSEKFLSTYGKNITFESTLELVQEPKPDSTSNTAPSFKKHIGIFIFTLCTVALLLIGGVFIIGFATIFVVGYLLRTLFGGANASDKNFFIVKKF